jgi:flagellin-like hook-associated protein FlgL
MRLKIMLLIIGLIISVQAAAGSSSIGVGASPGNLSFELAPATSAEQSLYVINTGNETATYGIYVDGNTYDDWFTFSSTSFDLKAGEYREVKVKLSVPATAETDVECKIKIPCTVSGKFVGTGLIIPVNIKISPSEVNSEGGFSSASFSGKGRASPESSNEAGVKEISEQLIANASILMADSKQEITSAGEKLKASAENWEETANKSLDNASAGLGKVTRKFEDTSRRIEDTKKEFEDKKKRFEDINIICRDMIQYIDDFIKICLAKILT